MTPLSTINGEFTYGRLRRRGYTDTEIKEAIACGFLVPNRRTGTLRTENRRRSTFKVPASDRPLGPAFMGLRENMGDHQPGQRVARVVDGKVQYLQVVTDGGDEIEVIDPEDRERIIRVKKDEVTAGGEDDRGQDQELGGGQEQEGPGVYERQKQKRQNWIATGRRIGEGEQAYAVEDEVMEDDEPYAVGENIGEAMADDGYDDGEDEEDEYGDEALGELARILSRDYLTITKDLDEFNRAGDKLTFMAWDGRYTDKMAIERPGDVYFRARSTNDEIRGTDVWSIEWLRNQVDSGSLAHEYLGGIVNILENFEEDYGDDDDEYYGDDDDMDESEEKRVGVLKSLKQMHMRLQSATGDLYDKINDRIQELKAKWSIKDDREFLRLREVTESVRPSELPDSLQAQYKSLSKAARQGTDGEEACVMYYPSFSEDYDGRIAVVRDSSIEQEMANGALMVNEGVFNDYQVSQIDRDREVEAEPQCACGLPASPESGECLVCGNPICDHCADGSGFCIECEEKGMPEDLDRFYEALGVDSLDKPSDPGYTSGMSNKFNRFKVGDSVVFNGTPRNRMGIQTGEKGKIVKIEYDGKGNEPSEYTAQFPGRAIGLAGQYSFDDTSRIITPDTGGVQEDYGQEPPIGPDYDTRKRDGYDPEFPDDDLLVRNRRDMERLMAQYTDALPDPSTVQFDQIGFDVNCPQYGNERFDFPFRAGAFKEILGRKSTGNNGFQEEDTGVWTKENGEFKAVVQDNMGRPEWAILQNGEPMDRYDYSPADDLDSAFDAASRALDVIRFD